MIRHASNARLGIPSDADVKLRFVENPDKMLSEEDRKRLPAVAVEQKATVWFPKNAPAGVVQGIGLYGHVPKNNYEVHQLQRDWAVIKAVENATGPGAPMIDHWPMTNAPIVVLIEGRSTPVEGMVVEHLIEKESGGYRGEFVFVELLRDGDLSGALLTCQIETKLGDGEFPEFGLRTKTFCLQDFNKIYAWAELTDEGVTYKPKVALEPTDLFLDVKYDDKRNKILSMALVTKLGTVYYAFDSSAVELAHDQFILEHVAPVFLEVPRGTVVYDCNRYGKHGDEGFQEWLKGVFAAQNLEFAHLVIHTDFPPDVAYFSRLLHTGDGLRIGKMPRMTFDIEFIDAYPTPIKDAVRYNAAWDAVAIWHHLGYYRYKVMHDVTSAVATAYEGGGTWEQRHKFVQDMAARKPEAVPMGIPTAGFNKEQQAILLAELAKAPVKRDYTAMTEDNATALGATAEDLIVEPVVAKPAEVMNGTRAIHPGEFLLDDFLKPTKTSVVKFAEESRIPVEQIQQLLDGKIGIDPSNVGGITHAVNKIAGTELTMGYWLSLQTVHDGLTSGSGCDGDLHPALQAGSFEEYTEGLMKKVFEETSVPEAPEKKSSSDSTGAMAAAWFGTPGTEKAVEAVFGKKETAKPRVIVVGNRNTSMALHALALAAVVPQLPTEPMSIDVAREMLFKTSDEMKANTTESAEDIAKGTGLLYNLLRVNREMTDKDLAVALGYDLDPLEPEAQESMIRHAIIHETFHLQGLREWSETIDASAAQLAAEAHPKVELKEDIPPGKSLEELLAAEERIPFTAEVKVKASAFETQKSTLLLKHNLKRVGLTKAEVEVLVTNYYKDCTPTVVNLANVFTNVNPNNEVTEEVLQTLGSLTEENRVEVVTNLLAAWLELKK